MFNNIVQNHVFKVSKQFKQVRHYQSEKELENDLLTSIINISKNRMFNNSKDARYFLRIRNGKHWSKTTTSGLLETNKSLLYYGDIAKKVNGIFKKTHLLIFKFNRGGTELKIDVYKNFYPRNTTELLKVLSNYY
jgi:hypothetical protein